MMQRPFTGWHMLAVMVAFFGVVSAVNFTMARLAIGSFGGVVVDNSYVASQEFNGWFERVEAQSQLGWEVETELRADRRITVTVAHAPQLMAVAAVVRPPLGHEEERVVTFDRVAAGEYVSKDALPEGRWTMRLQLQSGEDGWRMEKELR